MLEYIFEHNCRIEACNYAQKFTPSSMILTLFEISQDLFKRTTALLWDAFEPLKKTVSKKESRTNLK